MPTVEYERVLAYLEQNLKNHPIRRERDNFMFGEHELGTNINFKSVDTSSGGRNDCLIFSVIGAIKPDSFLYGNLNEVVNRFRRTYLLDHLPQGDLDSRIDGTTVRRLLGSKQFLPDDILRILGRIWHVNFSVFQMVGIGNQVRGITPLEHDEGAAHYLILHTGFGHFEKLYCQSDDDWRTRLDSHTMENVTEHFYERQRSRLPATFDFSKPKEIADEIAAIDKVYREKEANDREAQAKKVLSTFKKFDDISQKVTINNDIKTKFTFLRQVFTVIYEDNGAVLVEPNPMSYPEYIKYYAIHLAQCLSDQEPPKPGHLMYLRLEHLAPLKAVVVDGTSYPVLKGTFGVLDLDTADGTLVSVYQNNVSVADQDKLAAFSSTFKAPNIVLVEGAQEKIKVLPAEDDLLDLTTILEPDEPLKKLEWHVNGALPFYIPTGTLAIKDKVYEHATIKKMLLNFLPVCRQVFLSEVVQENIFMPAGFVSALQNKFISIVNVNPDNVAGFRVIFQKGDNYEVPDDDPKIVYVPKIDETLLGKTDLTELPEIDPGVLTPAVQFLRELFENFYASKEQLFVLTPFDNMPKNIEYAVLFRAIDAVLRLDHIVNKTKRILFCVDKDTYMKYFELLKKLAPIPRIDERRTEAYYTNDEWNTLTRSGNEN